MKIVCLFFLAVSVVGCAHHPVDNTLSRKSDVTECHLSLVQIERLREFGRIKSYLQQNVFPAWDNQWPNLFLYDERCQYILNYTGITPDRFKLTTQSIILPELKTDKIYSTRNVISLPDDTELSISIPAQAFTYGSQQKQKWFVMGLYEVWQRDFKDSIDFYYGILAHEMFHSYQFRHSHLQNRMERFSSKTFTNFYAQNSEFAKLVEIEKRILIAAIFAKSKQEKIRLISNFLSARKKRKQLFFIENLADMAAAESFVETIEGTAEYMNFRVMTDAKKFQSNEELIKIDHAFNNFNTYSKLTFVEAVDLVKDRPSYVQSNGVLLIILLDQVVPNWQAVIFEQKNGAEDIFKKITTVFDSTQTRPNITN